MSLLLQQALEDARGLGFTSTLGADVDARHEAHVTIGTDAAHEKLSRLRAIMPDIATRRKDLSEQELATFKDLALWGLTRDDGTGFLLGPDFGVILMGTGTLDEPIAQLVAEAVRETDESNRERHYGGHRGFHLDQCWRLATVLSCVTPLMPPDVKDDFRGVLGPLDSTGDARSLITRANRIQGEYDELQARNRAQ